MIKRKVFVGCSSEVLKTKIIDTLKKMFREDARFVSFEIQVWNETIWKNLQTATATLEASLTQYDYAIFIGFPDDIVQCNSQQYYTTRDNVTFEFGLFLSYLGAERTFFFKPKYSKRFHEFKIMSDLGDSALVHLFKLKLDNDENFVFDGFVNFKQFLDQINTVEKKSHCEPNKEILNNKVKLLKQQILDLPIVNEKEGIEKFKKAIDPILQLKKSITGISLFDIICDTLDTIKDIEDICKPKRIAELQSHEQGINEVWIFADNPLEFQPPNVHNPDLDILKSKVIENLQKGVKYIYFVSSNFDKSNIKKYFSKEKEILQNLHLIYIDTKFFKTYFTLHFKNKSEFPVIYMSSLLLHRDDLLIQISDPNHKKRIYDRISKHKGQVDKNDDFEVTDYTVKT